MSTVNEIIEYTRSTVDSVHKGTGLCTQDMNYIAWSTGDKRPGVVIYELQSDQTLEAVWNNQDAGLIVGTGKSEPKQPPSPSEDDSFVGSYKITYKAKKEYPPLQLTIKRLDTGSYHLNWESSTRHYVGIGKRVKQGGRELLAAAWDSYDGKDPEKEVEKLSLEIWAKPRSLPKPGQSWDVLQEKARALADLAQRASGESQTKTVTIFGSYTEPPGVEVPAVHSMSTHLYVLKAGAKDNQTPHREDEIYYILEGSGSMTIKTENTPEKTKPVKQGDLIFVPAAADHRFVPETDLVLLVVFAPNFTG